MHDTLVTYILNLADTRPNAKGQLGVLKLYTKRTASAIRRSLNCISLDVLIEHCVSYGATDADVRSAIGSLMPSAGSGSELHVVIQTDVWKRAVRSKTLANRDAQIENRMTYLRAYGLGESTSLPPLDVMIQ